MSAEAQCKDLGDKEFKGIERRAQLAKNSTCNRCKYFNLGMDCIYVRYVHIYLNTFKFNLQPISYPCNVLSKKF
jgi:hypothetical protein